MLIVLTTYAVIVWLLFAKFKLVKWGWASGTLTAVIGAFILAVFLAAFNTLTPAGRFVVFGRVVEVAPNVAGQVIAIPVTANAAVKPGDVLFQIDPQPYKAKVAQLEASLAQANQQAAQLQATYDQAKAGVDGLTKQIAYQGQRLADVQKLAAGGSQAEFRLQDTRAQYDTLQFQLTASQAALANAKLALESNIGGVNPLVAQVSAQLDDARWELQQTTVRAPSSGYVTVLALAVGARALPARPVMSFVVSDEIAIIGMFPPNGFQTIAPGTRVKLVFDEEPGRVYDAAILDVPRGVGQGQVAVSGQLARVGSIGGATTYPATISVPQGYARDRLRLGMPGSAWVFAPNAGPIGVISSILAWVASYTAYL